MHHVDVKREHFVTKMAARHYTRRLLLKVWCAWHGVIESRWKQHAEKACQVSRDGGDGAFHNSDTGKIIMFRGITKKLILSIRGDVAISCDYPFNKASASSASALLTLYVHGGI